MEGSRSDEQGLRPNDGLGLILAASTRKAEEQDVQPQALSQSSNDLAAAAQALRLRWRTSC